MSGSLGGKRMPIFVAEGNKRPHDLAQAAKFASEASIVVRREVPILMHFKHYKMDHGMVYLQKFMDRLTVCMGIPSLHSTMP
jgi:hypothetical protein